MTRAELTAAAARAADWPRGYGNRWLYSARLALDIRDRQTAAEMLEKLPSLADYG